MISFPVNEDMPLIIQKRHCADYFALTFKEQSALVYLCWINWKKLFLRGQPQMGTIGNQQMEESVDNRKITFHIQFDS